MKNFLAITLIWLGCIGVFCGIYPSSTDRFFLCMGALVSYGILMPTYLFSWWIRVKRKSVEKASRIFYAGYFYRFMALFAVIIGFDKYLNFPINTFVPFLLFFYLLLLFLEAGILSYEFNRSDALKSQKKF